MARNFRLGSRAATQARDVPAEPKKTGPVVLYTAVPVAKKDVAQFRRWADCNEWIRCHDADTEILTRRGWVSFPALQSTDEVMTYNRASGLLEFQRPLALVAAPYDGDLYHIRSSQIDLAVTPNHRILYQPGKVPVGVGVGGDGPVSLEGWRTDRIDSIPVRSAAVRFRVAGRWEGCEAAYFILPEVSYGNGRSGESGSGIGHHRAPLPPFPMHTWLQFLGYFISEGCLSTAASGKYYIRLCNKDAALLEKMRMVCAALFGRDPKPVPKNGGNDGYDLLVYGKQLWAWLSAEVGHRAEHKRVPRFVFDLPPSYLEILLQALMEGDGSWHPIPTRSSGTYYTASKGLADDVQELALRLGWRCIISTRQRPADRRVQYLVSMTKARDTATVCMEKHCKVLPYSGMVYCVSVPNETIVTRRNGRISIHLNSAINHRKTQISGAPWDIGTIDPNKPVDEELKLALIGLFSRPNTKTDSFRLLIEPVIEDLLVLDAGVIEIVRSVRGFPVQLWPVDGAWIRLDPAWDGDPTKPRYFWYPQGRFAASLLDQDLIYIMANPSSHRVVGLSPLETLKETIDAEIAAARYNKGQVIQSPPAGIIDLGEDATPENIDQFEKYWRAEIAGYKATAVVGGTKNMKFVPFGQSNRDMQFLQWQTYLIRKIAAVFQMSPQDLGILFDVNRANATVQAELSEDRGLRPLISLIESHLNREVVGEFARVYAKQAYWRGHIPHETLRLAMGLSWLDPTTPQVQSLYKQITEANILNLYFKFRIPSGRSARARADIHRIELGGIPYMTVNEVREEELKDGVEGGDEILVPTPMGPIRLSTIQGSTLPSPAEEKFLERLLQEPPILLGTGRTSVPADDNGEE